MENPITTNGWNEYKRLVLKQLEDLTDEVKELRDVDNKAMLSKIECIKNDVTILKTKIAMYAGALGLVGGVATQLIIVLLKAIHL